MRRYILMMTVFMILLAVNITADAEQYLRPGISIDSIYYQEGTGLWTGRHAVEYTRGYTQITSRYPLIGDVDGDLINEIIIIANNTLEILNYTTGLGIASEQSVTHGAAPQTATKFFITPALFDFDSDGTYEIISSNFTHMIVFSYNGTQIVVNRSDQIDMTVAAAGGIAFTSPVIKCAQSTQWASGNDTCVMPITNKSGAGQGIPTFIAYDVTNNIVEAVQATTPISNVDGSLKNTHLADGDGDGFLEAYFMREDIANGYTMTFKMEVDVTPTITELFVHDLDANDPHTDIVVYDLLKNGGDLEITFGYSDDQTNYDAATYNANTGALIDAGYCGIFTCPEGNMLSDNMLISSDTTYCPFVGDAYYYIRNYDKDDPGANIDTVYCISRYFGIIFQETEIISTTNFTSRPIIHQASLYGTTGLLTPRFGIQGGTAQVFPSITEQRVIIPVDYSKTGTLDLIGLSETLLIYYDDAYTNQNMQVNSIAPDTGNPICTGETLTTTVGISDVENNIGDCYLRVTYANNTPYSNVSNQTITAGQAAFTAFFTATATTQTSFIHYYSCKDQFHDAYTERPYSVTYSNQTCGSGTCNCKGFGAPTPTVYDVNLTAGDDADIITDVFDEFGITGTTSQAIIGIAFIIAMMVFVAQITPAPFVIAAAGILATMIVTVMGLISAFILILILVTLVLLAVIGKFIIGGSDSTQ